MQRDGFDLPERTTAKGNAALGNGGDGFDLDGDSVLTGSVAHGNFRGIDMAARGVVTKCAVAGNLGFGIVVREAGTAITKTSIFGNDVRGDTTTVDRRRSIAASRATSSTWSLRGAPGGPGDDPADALCRDGAAVDDGPVTPVAGSEIKVKPKVAK